MVDLSGAPACKGGTKLLPCAGQGGVLQEIGGTFGFGIWPAGDPDLNVAPFLLEGSLSRPEWQDVGYADSSNAFLLNFSRKLDCIYIS